jgi:hypothetical protein
MSNHDIQNDSEEKFVPLKDNNNNLSAIKIITYIVLLGGVIFGVTAGVQYAGAYLRNEDQMNFKMQHQRFIKDSDENKIVVTKEEKESMEKKEKENIQGVDNRTEEMKVDSKKMDDKKSEEMNH